MRLHRAGRAALPRSNWCRQLDIANHGSVQRFAESFGRGEVAILINNAGGWARGSSGAGVSPVAVTVTFAMWGTWGVIHTQTLCTWLPSRGLSLAPPS